VYGGFFEKFLSLVRRSPKSVSHGSAGNQHNTRVDRWRGAASPYGDFVTVN